MKNFKLAVLVAVVLSLLYSCITDSKALQTVLTKKPLFDTVGKVYTQLHPCDNAVIKAKSDTIIKYDSTISYEPYYIDCPDTYDTHHDTIPKKIKVLVPVKTYINNTKIIDSITRVDNQQIKILESEIAYDNVKLGELTGQITATQGQVVTEHHRGNDWALRFWLLLLGIVIAIVLMIIKPKI